MTMLLRKGYKNYGFFLCNLSTDPLVLISERKIELAIKIFEKCNFFGKKQSKVLETIKGV